MAAEILSGSRVGASRTLHPLAEGAKLTLLHFRAVTDVVVSQFITWSHSYGELNREQKAYEKILIGVVFGRKQPAATC